MLNSWRSVVVVVRVDVASKTSGSILSRAESVILISIPGCVGNVDVMGNRDSSPGKYIYVYSTISSLNHLKLDRSDVVHVICTVVGQMLPFNGEGIVAKDASETPEIQPLK